MMLFEDIIHHTDAVCSLSLRDQVACLLQAVEPVLPIWSRWARQHTTPDLSHELFVVLQGWLSSQESSTRLKLIARKFASLLPEDPTQDNDPYGALAGEALAAVPTIALDQCEDVHRDVVYTCVVYAAIASYGQGHRLTGIIPKNLDKVELAFIETWWIQCCELFPILPQLLNEVKHIDWDLEL